jgi:hypothetical protein
MDIPNIQLWLKDNRTDSELRSMIVHLHAELKLRENRTIAVVGGCECGIGYVEQFDSLDSGTTLRCEKGHAIVIDVWTPEARADFFKKLFERGS